MENQLVEFWSRESPTSIRTWNVQCWTGWHHRTPIFLRFLNTNSFCFLTHQSDCQQLCPGVTQTDFCVRQKRKGITIGHCCSKKKLLWYHQKPLVIVGCCLKSKHYDLLTPQKPGWSSGCTKKSRVMTETNKYKKPCWFIIVGGPLLQEVVHGSLFPQLVSTILY